MFRTPMKGFHTQVQALMRCLTVLWDMNMMVTETGQEQEIQAAAPYV